MVPVNKEIGSFEATPDEGVFSQEELKFAQQCAGEILWLSQRSRPDLGYVASLLSSLTTKAPRRVAEITMKVLGYLQRTMEHALFLEADSTGLVSYADSSFAPSGSRSHTGWVTMLFGAPISWRSSRQSTTSLSTGEAELNAAVEGALALLSSQALLTDVIEVPIDLVLETDSTTALSLAEGSGSWRTRHLRIKANWLYEHIRAGHLKMVHRSGEIQPADVLTKAMPSTRMMQLMQLWNLKMRVEELEDELGAEIASTTSPGMRVLLALMILAQSITPSSSERLGQDIATLDEVEPLKIDRGLATWMVFWGMVFLAVAAWELLKWMGWQAFFRLSPGASSRRMRRLQRLRDATAQAIADEFMRRAQEPEMEPEQVPHVDFGPASSSRNGRRDEVQAHSRRTSVERQVQTAHLLLQGQILRHNKW